VAPIKALCSERYHDWSKKFGSFGLKCTELTGDTDIDDFQDLHRSHMVFTTPVSWWSDWYCTYFCTWIVLQFSWVPLNC